MPTDLLPMHVADLRRTSGADPDSIRNIVYLEDDAGSRRLPIWIGPAEAIALAVVLEEVQLPRPWTHQLTAALLQAAGGSVREVLERSDTLAGPERTEAETAREHGDDASAIARDTQERLEREAQRFRDKGEAA